MKKESAIKLFDGKNIRTAWDTEAEQWYFSVVDVIAVLTDQPTQIGARTYWKVLKHRLTKEGNETVTNCNQLKLPAEDGKMRSTDVASTEQLFRLIQSVPSPKAEPFKLWLARVGSERLDETVDPELSIDRAIPNYRRLGHSENWINQRIKAIEVRLEKPQRGDLISAQGSALGLSKKEFQALKGRAKSRKYSPTRRASLSPLRYHFSSRLRTSHFRLPYWVAPSGLYPFVLRPRALPWAALGRPFRAISAVRRPAGFGESARVAQEGAKAAKAAREQIEKNTGKSAVSPLNAKNLAQIALDIPDTTKPTITEK